MRRPSLIKSIQHAWRGFGVALKSERNFRLQTLAALAALACALIFPLTKTERLLVLVVTLAVLVLELLNTAVERLVDLMKPRLMDVAGEIKDVMAAAVLLASVFAVAIGLYIFIPYILPLWRNL